MYANLYNYFIYTSLLLNNAKIFLILNTCATKLFIKGIKRFQFEGNLNKILLILLRKLRQINLFESVYCKYNRFSTFYLFLYLRCINILNSNIITFKTKTDIFILLRQELQFLRQKRRSKKK